MFAGITLFFRRLRLLPHFLFCVGVDVFKWIKGRRWEAFEGWGLHIYLGAFGQGKTCSMVRDAYAQCCKYKDLQILTNLKLCNFPKHTVIKPLIGDMDILNAPDNTLVLIDEIGTIFNSRDFSSGKTAVPKSLYQHLCQCRHRRIMIYGTVQRFNLLDKQIRDISADVTFCSCHFKHPFSRLCIMQHYDIDEFETAQANKLYIPRPDNVSAYIQRDENRSLYDTTELIQGMLKKEYLSDSEILENRGEYQPNYTPLDKSSRKSYYKRNKY